MSVVAAFPNLSQLLAWPTEHLTEAADHWEAVGGRCYGVANQVWRDALAGCRSCQVIGWCVGHCRRWLLALEDLAGVRGVL
ncbi:hypothetical protein LAUMK13_04399 [Mycobacterium innocens]|uniref:Uncharacterized protein n=1 Tax=Mycobacterium innocens TaxID=2341083 RepID=A0A498QFA9_9MYCO|nr:hypothetical protein LAUMK13_04399 [Mycobacterium innocens]